MIHSGAARREELVELALVGGATFLLLPLGWVLRHWLGLDDAELVFGFTTFYAAYVVNDPHFTVTYFLFYEDARRRALGEEVERAQKLRWVVAGIVVPALLALWGASALVRHSAQSIGWMTQLMFALVGYHYVKQGFGVLTVLSARRGVRITDVERRVILAHALAAWGFGWANPAAPAGEFEEKGVVYWAPARPPWLESALAVALLVSTLAFVVVLVQKRRRDGRGLPAVPLTAFLVTVWSWTVFSSIDPLLRYAIPALHSVQYMYFVWLMRSGRARAEEGPPSFGRPVSARIAGLALGALGLGLLLFRFGPTFLDTAFAPRLGRPDEPLGATPFFAVFFVAVNLHHYAMDAVIWRRQNPETRYLLKPSCGGSGDG